jgi:hypothetical protein
MASAAAYPEAMTILGNPWWVNRLLGYGWRVMVVGGIIAALVVAFR